MKDKYTYVSAEEAVRHVPSDCRIVVGHATGEPSVLLDALVKNHEQYHNVEIAHMICSGKGEYARPQMRKHFRHNAIYVSKPTENAVREGLADFTPVYMQRLPELFQNGLMPVDVAFVQLSPPDRLGWCSFGISNDYTKPAAENARMIIAEVNEMMPRVLGDNFIHFSQIDYAVKTCRPLLEAPPLVPTAVEEAIGEYCASLVEDGSTLQLGVGGIPNALLSCLKKKKDLGIHSEMISDGAVDLIERGIINNKRKTIHRGKTIVSFLYGTKLLYDYAHDNPAIELYPVNYVNDPFLIRQNYKMVSINSCVQVDFMGQVTAEAVGPRQISGVGGQVDFVRGASMAKEGKSIIAMLSTAVNGRKSRIVPDLEPGTPVTTNRNDVQIIVTEYGIADLRGKSLRQRARALIDIAHPDFRDSLAEVWRKRFVYQES